MSNNIAVPPDTKKAHSDYIGWLNRLLTNYVSSFYDNAIKNIIEMSFILEYNSFLLELYLGEGRELSGFMTVLPTDITGTILMIHANGSGEPFLYNDSNGTDLFEFDTNGRLTKFYDNVTIDLKNPLGVVVARCFIGYEEWYGIKAPMYYIRENGSNALIGKGFIDVNYSGKYSGTYLVRNKPLDNYPKFKVTNTTLAKIVLDVPILRNLNIRYEIRAKAAKIIPITQWSEYYLKQGKNLNGIRVERQ